MKITQNIQTYELDITGRNLGHRVLPTHHHSKI